MSPGGEPGLLRLPSCDNGGITVKPSEISAGNFHHIDIEGLEPLISIPIFGTLAVSSELTCAQGRFGQQ